MLVLLGVLAGFVLIGGIAAVITGLVAISPIFLILILGPFLDVLVFKLIWNKKKRK